MKSITFSGDTDSDICLAIARELVGRQANYFEGPENIRQAFQIALSQEHRTIQQSFMGALKLTIEDYATLRFDQHCYDARNELAVLWAHEVQSLNTKLGHEGQRFPLV